MRPVENMLRISTAPIETILKLREEVERRRREPNAKETDITHYAQSVLRESELNASKKQKY